MEDGGPGSGPSPAGGDPPCLLLPLPLLLPGTKEADWAASCKAGRPCAPPPGPSSRSCYPFPPPHPEGADRDPRGRRGETPPLQAAIGKRSLALTLDPQPLQGAAQALARGGGVSQPRRGSPGEQPGAEVRVLQRVGLLLRGGDSGCLLPAGAGAEPGHAAPGGAGGIAGDPTTSPVRSARAREPPASGRGASAASPVVS